MSLSEGGGRCAYKCSNQLSAELARNDVTGTTDARRSALRGALDNFARICNSALIGRSDCNSFLSILCVGRLIGLNGAEDCYDHR